VAGETLSISIEGSNFSTTAATVEFSGGAMIVTSMTVLNATRINATVVVSGAAYAGKVNCFVRNLDTGGMAWRGFDILEPIPGFTITGVWPNLPDNGFPQGSIISPFIIIGTGISTDAIVSFDDQRITYDATAVTIDPTGGQWIRIAHLRIGSDAAVGRSNVVVTNNPGKTTAATANTYMYVIAQSTFLTAISNVVPVYSGNKSYFDPAVQPQMEFKGVLNDRNVTKIKAMVMNGSGIAQVTDFNHVDVQSSVSVQGLGGTVRSLDVAPASGTFTMRLPYKNDFGQNLSNGIGTLYLMPDRGPATKIHFIVVNPK